MFFRFAGCARKPARDQIQRSISTGGAVNAGNCPSGRPTHNLDLLRHTLPEGGCEALFLKSALAFNNSTIICNTSMIVYIFPQSSTANKHSELKIRQIRTSKYTLNDAASLQKHQGMIFENFEKIEKMTFFTTFLNTEN